MIKHSRSKKRMPIILSVFLFVYTCLGTFNSFAEMIKLKSGELIEGKIIENTDKLIKFTDKVGTILSLNLDDIDTIDGDREVVEACKICKLYDMIRNSKNVEATIVYDESYPYIGFWKKDCTHDFGFVFERAIEGKYSVIFCGPGGCFKQGRMPLTTLVNDPYYTIINDDKIIINGSIEVHRCKANQLNMLGTK